MATAAPAFVIDAINGLLEAELNSVFRFINEGSPYVSRATAEVRRPLAELSALSRKHTRELAQLIESLGGSPSPRQHPRTQDQYFAYLSLKFLLPKLVSEKQLIIQRYENAKRAIGKDHPQVIAELNRIEVEEQQYLEVLKRAAHDVTGGRYKGNGDPSEPVHSGGPKDSDSGPSAD
jgi:hypothetical protein